MMMKRSLLPLLFVFALLAPAYAQQGVPAPASNPALPAVVSPVVGVPATFENVILAAIKQNGIDMSSDGAIDDFARVEYCDIYRKYYPNEFDWRRVRVALRKKIEIDKPNYPDTLYLEREEEFGQYDFKAGMLTLLPKAVLHTRALLLATVSQKYCDGAMVVFPDRILAFLDKSLDFEGIELTEEEARAVTAGMRVDADAKHAYGRYTIKIIGTEPVRAVGPAKLDAKLLDVTIYQDPDYQRPFWSGLSSVKAHQERDGAGVLDVIPFKGIDPQTGAQQKLDPSKPLPTVGPPAPAAPATK